MNERKPFNDVTDHYGRHVGLPNQVEMKKLPLPIRIIGYMAFVLGAIAACIFVIGMLYQWLT